MGRSTTSIDASPAGAVPGLASRLADRSVDIALAGVLTAAFVYLMGLTSEAYFAFDDWKLAGRSYRGLLLPYNDHLSLVILALYRLLVESFGFSYTPFRVVGLLCLLGVPASYFLTTRRVLGPPLAALGALAMLAFGNVELYPAALNHYVVLIAAVLCAAALNRSERADGLLAGALVLALSASGAGLAVAAACLVHNACTRPPLRRWLVVLGASGLWGGWWLALARGASSQFRPIERPAFSEAASYARDIVIAPFEHLGAGRPLIALALGVGFLAFGRLRLRQGLGAAATFMAWSSALAVWAAGLAYGRGPLVATPIEQGQVIYFRYQILALGFVLLAVVPTQPIRWPERFPLASGSRWLGAAAALTLLMGSAIGLAIRSDVEQNARWLEGYGRATKGELLVLTLGPDVVPDDASMSVGFFNIDAGEVRALLERYGNHVTASWETVDQQLVEIGVVSARAVPLPVAVCQPVAETILRTPSSDRVLVLWSDRAEWSVSVRRFGDDWITLGRAGAGQALALRLPGFGSDRPWQVRADGACTAASSG